MNPRVRSRVEPPDAAPAPPTRKIIHVDMDCFYAAVEEREQPDLRGRPLGVGGARDRRGVLTTCNYEARKFGVRSAMPTFQALELCPHLTVVPARFDLYRADSARVRAIFLEYTPLVEPLSLDEAYLDVSHLEAPATRIAREIRARIYETTGLTASAGVSSNKMLAKIASDLRKPNGQCTIQPAEIAPFMQTLPVKKIPGIGTVTGEKLARMGVETCGQLQALERSELQTAFGKFGAELYERCRGRDDRTVEPDRERKSLSNESTFSANLVTLEACQAKLLDLHAELLEDLAKKEATRLVAKVFVKLRFADFTKTTVERVSEEPDLSAYQPLLEEGWSRRHPRQRSVRLLGVGVRFKSERSSESAQSAQQLLLTL